MSIKLSTAVAALIAMAPYLLSALRRKPISRFVDRLPILTRILLPAILGVSYAVFALSHDLFHWYWLMLYCILPIALAVLMEQAREADPAQRGNWRDWLLLAILGLAVDLRWFESAWAPHFGAFNKVLLLDAGIYAVMFVRHLDGVGFDLRLGFGDLKYGIREVLFYAPIAVFLGVGLGFLHFHAIWPSLIQISTAVLFTFFFIAVPEELFFRGWIQNLLERRFGRWPALVATAVLFGLSHWNKRTVNFNWRYVLLAAIAGLFYGRAWRQQRRVGTSAVTHTLVDTAWSLWLR